MEGGCTCGHVRYRLTRDPVVVHCCHCRWCQRETGSAFALNAVIETEHVELLQAPPERVDIPSESGRGQAIMRCPHCRVAVWSHYPGAGARAAFVRVGTLDNPGACPPHAHIFTASKQPWVSLPEAAGVFEDYYSAADMPRFFTPERMIRFRAIYPD